MPKTTGTAGQTMFQSGGPSVSFSAGQETGGPFTGWTPTSGWGGGFGGASPVVSQSYGVGLTGRPVLGRPWGGSGSYTAGVPWLSGSSPAAQTDSQIWGGGGGGWGADESSGGYDILEEARAIPTAVWIAAAVAVVGAVGYAAYKKDQKKGKGAKK